MLKLSWKFKSVDSCPGTKFVPLLLLQAWDVRISLHGRMQSENFLIMFCRWWSLDLFQVFSGSKYNQVKDGCGFCLCFIMSLVMFTSQFVSGNLRHPILSDFSLQLHLSALRNQPTEPAFSSHLLSISTLWSSHFIVRFSRESVRSLECYLVCF